MENQLQTQEKPKKSIWKKWWFWIIGVFVVIIIALGRGGGSITTIPTNQQEQQQLTWQTVKSWQGTGIKKTEPFKITGKQWRINWKSNGEYGIFQIYVYRPGDNLIVGVAANAQGNAEDVSYFYKTGTFYLDVIAANANWSITVEELK